MSLLPVVPMVEPVVPVLEPPVVPMVEPPVVPVVEVPGAPVPRLPVPESVVLLPLGLPDVRLSGVEALSVRWQPERATTSAVPATIQSALLFMRSMPSPE